MGKLDAANNVITYAGSAPSNAYYYRVFNQYTFYAGRGGYVDMCTITHFKRSKTNGPVTATKVEVTYTTNTNSSPYISDLFIDKRSGGKTKYLTVPAAHKLLKTSSSFSINLNESNVQSVQLYVHADKVAAGAGKGTRYQYITMFY